ncbi:MAG: protein translocase subunit SecF, partial [Pseudohongiellaceae bacterium]
MSTPARVFDFMGKRRLAAVFSAVLLIISLGSLLINGIKYGLDFTGGTQIEVLFPEPADLDQIRTLLTETGYENFEVVLFGSDEDVL